MIKITDRGINTMTDPYEQDLKAIAGLNTNPFINSLPTYGFLGALRGGIGLLGAGSSVALGINKLFNKPKTEYVYRNAQENITVKRKGGEKKKYYNGGPYQQYFDAAMNNSINPEEIPELPAVAQQESFDPFAEMRRRIYDTASNPSAVPPKDLVPRSTIPDIKRNEIDPGVQKALEESYKQKTSRNPIDEEGQYLAQGALAGMGAFNSFVSNQRMKRDRALDLQKLGNTDMIFDTLNYAGTNPFGQNTVNTYVYRPDTYGQVQDSGNNYSYKEGGEYMLSEEEIKKIIEQGGEIEFVE